MVSVSGPASLEAYTAFLQSLGYVSFSTNPDRSPRDISFYVSDGMYEVHHHMQLIHVCNATTENCGSSSNIACEMVDSTTPLCVCPLELTYDKPSRTCKKPVSCADSMGVCGSHSSCHQISETEVSCKCISGFENDSKSDCVNINDCENATCYNGGTCMDGNNTYSCVCTQNYTGFHCGVKIDMCHRNSCIHGHCEDNKCICETGYSYNGSQCEVDVGCLDTGCLNGGECVSENGRNLSQFTGPLCQSNKTESSATCKLTSLMYMLFSLSIKCFLDLVTTGAVIAIGASAGTFLILSIFIVAIICTLKRRRINSLKVEGRKRSSVLSICLG